MSAQTQPIAPPTENLVHAPAEELAGKLGELTDEDVKGLLSPVALEAWQAEMPHLAAAELSERGDEPRCALVALFCLGVTLPFAQALNALGESLLSGLVAGGVLTRVETEGGNGAQAGKVKSRFGFTPLSTNGGEYWFAHDLPQSVTGGGIPAGYVMGIGGATRSLLRLTPRAQVRHVLDVGTGCGVQAIVAAAHAQRVTATDVSVRALDLAAFNVRLNGIEPRRLELVRGSLLEPVAGRNFDLIVSNPPFVIAPVGKGESSRGEGTEGAPSAGLEYRQSGQSGDALTLDLLREVPIHLAPGGRAVMLANWLHAETDWRDRLLEVLPKQTDAWIMQRQFSTPLQYATMWLRDGGLRPGMGGFAPALDAYLRTLDTLGATGVGYGYVCLQRADGDGLLFAEDGALLQPPAGEDVETWSSACRWVRANGAQENLALSARRLQVADGVVEVRYFKPGEGDPSVITLQARNGRKLQVGQAMAALVGACDGELSLAQITNALGALLGREVDSLQVELGAALSQAVLTGLLLPLDEGGNAPRQ